MQSVWKPSMVKPIKTLRLSYSIDSSTDNSLQVLGKYRNHPKTSHYIINETNSGNTFIQWNKGISLAKGDYIWIAESDDYCDLDFLEKMLSKIEKDDGISFAYCQSHRLNEEGEVTGNWITHTHPFKTTFFDSDFIVEGKSFVQNFLVHYNVVPNVSAVLFRKSHLMKILPLETKDFLRYNADWFYYFQLLCNSKVAFLSETLNYFRYHSSSVIAKASSEDKLLKVYKMRVELYKRMLSYIHDNDFDQFSPIKIKCKKEIIKLYHKIGEIYISKSHFFSLMAFSFRHPRITKSLITQSFLKN